MAGNPKILSENNGTPEFECFRNVNPVEFRKLVETFPEAFKSLKNILNNACLHDNFDANKLQSITTCIDTLNKYKDTCNNNLKNKSILDEKKANHKCFDYYPLFFFEFDLQIKKLFDDQLNDISESDDVQETIRYAKRRTNVKSDFDNWQKFVKLYNNCFNNKFEQLIIDTK